MGNLRLHTDVFEINLLREPPKRTGLSVAGLLMAVLFLAGVLVPGWLWQEAKSRTEAGLAQLSGLDRQLLQLQARNKTVADAAGVSSLQAAVGGLKRFRPESSGMMEQFSRLLPVEADLKSLVYANGSVQATIDFASMEHVIAFLNEIERSDHFSLLSFGMLSNKKMDNAGTMDFSALRDEAVVWPDDVESGTWPDADEGKVLPVTSVLFELAYRPDGTAGASGVETGGRLE